MSNICVVLVTVAVLTYNNICFQHITCLYYLLVVVVVILSSAVQASLVKHCYVITLIYFGFIWCTVLPVSAQYKKYQILYCLNTRLSADFELEIENYAELMNPKLFQSTVPLGASTAFYDAPRPKQIPNISFY